MMLQRLRTLTTALAFGIFAFGALLQGLPLYFLIWLFCRNPVKRVLLLRRCVRLSFRFFVWLCRILGVFRVSGCLVAAENWHGVIIIANHPSLVDYVILCAMLPPSTSVMVKEKLTHSFMRFVIHGMRYINNESSHDEICDVLAQGDNVLIFPEGTRTREGQSLCFHRGFASLAIERQRLVQPVFIHCDSPGFLAKKFWNFSAPKKVPVFTIEQGEVFSSEKWTLGDVPRGIAARHMTHDIELIYTKQLESMSK